MTDQVTVTDDVTTEIADEVTGAHRSHGPRRSPRPRLSIRSLSSRRGPRAARDRRTPRGAVAGPRRPRLAALLCAAVVALPGCVTVEGATAWVAPLDEAAAAEVLERFEQENNQANADRDLELNARIETGALRDIDQATLKVAAATDPDNSEPAPQLDMGDPQLWIPRLNGYPKWFVAVTDVHGSTTTEHEDAPQGEQGAGEPIGRWMLLFTQAEQDGPWQAAYMAAAGDAVPAVALDQDGLAEEVPADDPALLLAPEEVPGAYTALLQGEASEEQAALFPEGAFTTDMLAEREAQAGGTQYVRQYLDSAAPEHGVYALRTEDGGALVFFATRHQSKLTMAQGRRLDIQDPEIRALLEGEARQQVLTTMDVAQQAVLVPPAAPGPEASDGSDDASGGSPAPPAGQLTFVDRQQATVSALAE
ncbi:hypothetical protein [Allostreptomyces psammosilenae]|uniref:DUF8094 domain-containing protein n=1 Tax=Allostreptomyces psammosilenae TaxID=1892865 RepID=A0A853A8N2_9ACTN|nr:hypothetical protein [Allostreptomyces psammosilenae]NYI06888.1 hypothetical protein [Allostreptomyces psammosilenae]